MIKLYDNGVYLLNGTEIGGRYRKCTGSAFQEEAAKEYDGIRHLKRA